jgi:Flp pilus assembly protein TadB
MRLRSDGLAAALDGLGADDRGRTAETVALLLRAGLVDLPAGGLAPLLRELAAMLSDRFEAREKARTRASSVQLEAGILAASPVVLLLLVGSSSPSYLAAYRGGVGTAVAAAGGVVIFACYLAMRRLGQVPDPGARRGAR